MTTRLVCVDAADTLFTERSSRAAMYVEAFADHGVRVETETMAAWMGEVHEAMGATWRGHVGYSDGWFDGFVAALLDRAGAAADPVVVRADLSGRFTDPARYRVFDDVVPALRRWRELGLGVALVSNWSHRLRDLLGELGLLDALDTLSISEEVGAAKPAAALFHHALDRNGVAAGEALHVGNDLARDVAGARGAGLAAVWLDRRGRGDVPAGVPRVPRLTGVEAHLDLG